MIGVHSGTRWKDVPFLMTLGKLVLVMEGHLKPIRHLNWADRWTRTGLHIAMLNPHTHRSSLLYLTSQGWIRGKGVRTLSLTSISYNSLFLLNWYFCWRTLDPWDERACPRSVAIKPATSVTATAECGAYRQISAHSNWRQSVSKRNE